MSVKGDWSRVQDTESYRNNYDNIFRKKNKESGEKPVEKENINSDESSNIQTISLRDRDDNPK
jgi:hypothetical protein